MVELRSEEVQKGPKKRTRGQGKPPVDMGGYQDALTLARFRLRLLPREASSLVGHESPLHHVVDIRLSKDGGHPIPLQPAGRQSSPRGRPASAGFLPFALRRGLLRPFRRRRLVRPHRLERGLGRAAVSRLRRRARRKLTEEGGGRTRAHSKKSESLLY